MLKGFIGFVWGSPWLSHHPTPYKKDSISSVHLPKLSESYTDHSTIWKISFWRRTNWHPQSRGFLFRGKLGFTYCANLKVCFAIRYLAEYHYMFTKHSLVCSVNKILHIHVFTSVCKDCWYSLAVTLLHVCKKPRLCLSSFLPFICYGHVVAITVAKLDSANTVGEGMFEKKKKEVK